MSNLLIEIYLKVRNCQITESVHFLAEFLNRVDSPGVACNLHTQSLTQTGQNLKVKKSIREMAIEIVFLCDKLLTSCKKIFKIEIRPDHISRWHRVGAIIKGSQLDVGSSISEKLGRNFKAAEWLKCLEAPEIAAFTSTHHRHLPLTHKRSTLEDSDLPAQTSSVDLFCHQNYC